MSSSRPWTLPRRSDRTGGRRRLRVPPVVALLLAACVTSPLTAPQRVSDELRLKAAFLLRFPDFVEWPSAALDGRPTLELCVLAPNPFGRVLEQLAEGGSTAGRRLTVRQVKVDSVATCHLLYVPAAFTGRKSLVRRVATSPILTVSDAPRFLDEGGIVQLRLVQSRVRFDVSTAAAGRAGLRLSAQLLRLAEDVREDRP